MIKVVQYIPALVNGGIEAMLLNYYKNINNEFQFIIIVHGEVEPTCKVKFQNLGAKIYQISHWKTDLINHNRELFKILKEENPDIFHTHHGIYNFIPCFVAIWAKVRFRISHCHAYFPNKSMKERIFGFLSYVFANHYMACGVGASKYLLGDKKSLKAKILYNAIEMEKFKYNIKARKKIRKDLKWDTNVIFGNVGRFCEQKNQLFLVDICEKIYTQNKNARFIIIGGSGDKYNEIIDKLNKSLIKKYCVVLKNVQNVNEYYSAMDCFLLPSLFEGFAVSVIEAQFSNLPCVLSPTITKEFESKNIYFSKTLDNIDDWLQIINTVEFNDRKTALKDLDMFDINKAYIELEKYYYDMLGGKNEKCTR